jgi:hypothetical protein
MTMTQSTSDTAQQAQPTPPLQGSAAIARWRKQIRDFTDHAIAKLDFVDHTTTERRYIKAMCLLHFAETLLKAQAAQAAAPQTALTYTGQQYGQLKQDIEKLLAQAAEHGITSTVTVDSENEGAKLTVIISAPASEALGALLESTIREAHRQLVEADTLE